MDEMSLAGQILLCGVKLGKAGLREFAGHELVPLLETTFAELHKNNLPEEGFLFALIRMFKRDGNALPETIDVAELKGIKTVLDLVKDDSLYRTNSRAVELSTFSQEAVLRDFVHCLTQQFFHSQSAFHKIEQKFGARSKIS